MEIYNPLNLPKSTPTNPGSMYMDEYTMMVDKNGHKYIEVTGKTNVYLRTQAALESTKIETVIARFMGGDLNALNQRAAQYMDATQMPHSLAEAQNIIVQMYQDFETLPIEIKKAFNNAPEQWVAQYGSPEFIEKLKPFLKTKSNQKDETVKPIETDEKGE